MQEHCCSLMPLWCQKINSLVKKSECKVRQNSKAGVPTSIEVSSVSYIDPFLKSWKRHHVFGWKMRQRNGFNFHGSMHHVSIFVNKTSLMQLFRYLLYPSQLYMFRMLRPSILRSTVTYRREGTVYVRCNNICQVSKIS